MKARHLVAAAIASSLAFTAIAEESSDDDRGAFTEYTGAASDAWIDGKLEATYLINRGLSPFNIDTRVTDGKVLLTGAVKSPTQKQLAEEIAMSLEGVLSVNNEIVVREDAPERDGDERTFGDKVEDATLAARLKSEFLINSKIAGTDINVDVENGEVTLRGEVQDRSEAELAEYIAKNTDGVRSVKNKLTVIS